MARADRSKELDAGELAAEIADAYPDLRIVSEDAQIRVVGSFPIVHEGQVLDRFQIALDLPRDFPKSPPVVRETGGRIPCVAERHVNPNGEACVLVPEEWMVRPEREQTLRRFLDGPLRSFFIGQALVERGGDWPWGQRDHGRAGLLQAYGDLLETRDEKAIVRHLEYLSTKKIKGHWPCPCGSGQPLRACHVARVRKLQERIPRYVAQSALGRLKGGGAKSS